MKTQKAVRVYLCVWWRLFLLMLESCFSATQRTLSTGQTDPIISKQRKAGETRREGVCWNSL